MVGGGGEEAVEGFEDEDEDSLDEDILVDLPICVQVQINTMETRLSRNIFRDIYYIFSLKIVFSPTSLLKIIFYPGV